MAGLTRGEIRQMIVDRYPIEEANEPRTVRVINALIDDSDEALCGRHDWGWLYDIVRLPITATTTGILWPDGTTVLDSYGAVAPYVRNLLHVELVSTGKGLSHEDIVVDSFMNLSLNYRSRGTPGTWGAWGRYLYLSPFPASADSIDLLICKGHAPLINDAQEPLVPQDFRGYHVWDVLAKMWAVDGQDYRKQRSAEKEAENRLGAIFQFSPKAKPRLKSMPVLPFQV